MGSTGFTPQNSHSKLPSFMGLDQNSGNQESEESKKEDGVSRGKSTSNSLTDKQVSVFSCFPEFQIKRFRNR
jgi:hypothetical protein